MFLWTMRTHYSCSTPIGLNKTDTIFFKTNHHLMKTKFCSIIGILANRLSLKIGFNRRKATRLSKLTLEREYDIRMIYNTRSTTCTLYRNGSFISANSDLVGRSKSWSLVTSEYNMPFNIRHCSSPLCGSVLLVLIVRPPHPEFSSGTIYFFYFSKKEQV